MQRRQATSGVFNASSFQLPALASAVRPKANAKVRRSLARSQGKLNRRFGSGGKDNVWPPRYEPPEGLNPIAHEDGVQRVEPTQPRKMEMLEKYFKTKYDMNTTRVAMLNGVLDNGNKNVLPANWTMPAELRVDNFGGLAPPGALVQAQTDLQNQYIALDGTASEAEKQRYKKRVIRQWSREVNLRQQENIAIERILAQITLAKSDSEVAAAYIHRFHQFLRGKPCPDDAAKMKQLGFTDKEFMPFQGAGVQAYLKAFSAIRAEYYMALTLLKMRGPGTNLRDIEIYFKYLVDGDDLEKIGEKKIWHYLEFGRAEFPPEVVKELNMQYLYFAGWDEGTGAPVIKSTLGHVHEYRNVRPGNVGQTVVVAQQQRTAPPNYTPPTEQRRQALRSSAEERQLLLQQQRQQTELNLRGAINAVLPGNEMSLSNAQQMANLAVTSYVDQRMADANKITDPLQREQAIETIRADVMSALTQYSMAIANKTGRPPGPIGQNVIDNLLARYPNLAVTLGERSIADFRSNLPAEDSIGNPQVPRMPRGGNGGAGGTSTTPGTASQARREAKGKEKEGDDDAVSSAISEAGASKTTTTPSRSRREAGPGEAVYHHPKMNAQSAPRNSTLPAMPRGVPRAEREEALEAYREGPEALQRYFAERFNVDRRPETVEGKLESILFNIPRDPKTGELETTRKANGEMSTVSESKRDAIFNYIVEMDSLISGHNGGQIRSAGGTKLATMLSRIISDPAAHAMLNAELADGPYADAASDKAESARRFRAGEFTKEDFWGRIGEWMAIYEDDFRREHGSADAAREVFKDDRVPTIYKKELPGGVTIEEEPMDEEESGGGGGSTSGGPGPNTIARELEAPPPTQTQTQQPSTSGEKKEPTEDSIRRAMHALHELTDKWVNMQKTHPEQVAARFQEIRDRLYAGLETGQPPYLTPSERALFLMLGNNDNIIRELAVEIRDRNLGGSISSWLSRARPPLKAPLTNPLPAPPPGLLRSTDANPTEVIKNAPPNIKGFEKEYMRLRSINEFERANELRDEYLLPYYESKGVRRERLDEHLRNLTLEEATQHELNKPRDIPKIIGNPPGLGPQRAPSVQQFAPLSPALQNIVVPTSPSVKPPPIQIPPQIGQQMGRQMAGLAPVTTTLPTVTAPTVPPVTAPKPPPQVVAKERTAGRPLARRGQQPYRIAGAAPKPVAGTTVVPPKTSVAPTPMGPAPPPVKPAPVVAAAPPPIQTPTPVAPDTGAVKPLETKPATTSKRRQAVSKGKAAVHGPPASGKVTVVGQHGDGGAAAAAGLSGGGQDTMLDKMAKRFAQQQAAGGSVPTPLPALTGTNTVVSSSDTDTLRQAAFEQKAKERGEQPSSYRSAEHSMDAALKEAISHNVRPSLTDQESIQARQSGKWRQTFATMYPGVDYDLWLQGDDKVPTPMDEEEQVDLGGFDFKPQSTEEGPSSSGSTGDDEVLSQLLPSTSTKKIPPTDLLQAKLADEVNKRYGLKGGGGMISTAMTRHAAALRGNGTEKPQQRRLGELTVVALNDIEQYEAAEQVEGLSTTDKSEIRAARASARERLSALAKMYVHYDSQEVISNAYLATEEKRLIARAKVAAEKAELEHRLQLAHEQKQNAALKRQLEEEEAAPSTKVKTKRVDPAVQASYKEAKSRNKAKASQTAQKLAEGERGRTGHETSKKHKEVRAAYMKKAREEGQTPTISGLRKAKQAAKKGGK